MDRDPEQAIEHDAAELEERVQRLDGQLDDARQRLEERAREAQRLGPPEEADEPSED